MIVYKCPCGEVYKAADDQVGTVVRCLACGRSLVVPPRRVASVPVPDGVTTWRCECGRAYRLSYHRGVRRVRCPVCGAWGEVTGEPAVE
jgi:LSD1 subclass zinc finger protein